MATLKVLKLKINFLPFSHFLYSLICNSLTFSQIKMASKRKQSSSDDDSFGFKRQKTKNRIVFLGSDSSSDEADSQSKASNFTPSQRTNLSSQDSSQVSNRSASLLPSFNAGETPKKNHFDSDTEEEDESKVEKTEKKFHKKKNGHSDKKVCFIY